MEQDGELRTRERAYAIWQAEGCPEGRDMAHWLAAEAELVATLPSTLPSKSRRVVRKAKSAAAGIATVASARRRRPSPAAAADHA